MGPEERSNADVVMYVRNADGTMTPLGEVQSITVNQAEPVAEPIPSLEEVLAEAVESGAVTVEVPEAPAAMEEEPVDVSDLERLLQSFSNVTEGNLYSEEVNRAIEIIAGAESMQQVLELMRENEGMDFRHLLFRQIDQESRELDRFMFELQRIPSLPSMDVDFI